jgi:lipooligosaccharide transport system permease protein
VSTPLPVRVVEHQTQVFRKFWRSTLVTYIVTPLLFLLAMGKGLGGIIDHRSGPVGGVGYLHFVTPGLMVGAAMQGAVGESLWPVMAGQKWVRNYHAMIASPIRPVDVYLGVVAWATARVTIGATAFVVVASLLGGVVSPWAVLAILAAALTGAAFASVVTAFTATQETDLKFPVILRVGVMPLFLFSGTFFPVSQLPQGLRPIAAASPLWHGVELARAATTGRWHLGPAVVHVAFLVACIAAGWLWGRRTFTRRLAS